MELMLDQSVSFWWVLCGKSEEIIVYNLFGEIPDGMYADGLARLIASSRPIWALSGLTARF